MRSRRGIGVLAVCGLVLGLMAISASSAQAGKWMVNKVNVAGELKVEATVELEGGGTTLLSASGGNNVAITCTKAVVSSAVVSVVSISGALNFSGCTTKINGKAVAECTPLNQPVAVGLTIKAVLHEKVAYAKVEGLAGVLATFKFDCAALPETVKLTGVFWLEDCTFRFETEQTIHLVQEAIIPAGALGGLAFGSNLATMDGSLNVALSDTTHKGMTFSGLAE